MVDFTPRNIKTNGIHAEVAYNFLTNSGYDSEDLETIGMYPPLISLSSPTTINTLLTFISEQEPLVSALFNEYGKDGLLLVLQSFVEHISKEFEHNTLYDDDITQEQLIAGWKHVKAEIIPQLVKHPMTTFYYQ